MCSIHPIYSHIHKCNVTVSLSSLRGVVSIQSDRQLCTICCYFGFEPLNSSHRPNYRPQLDATNHRWIHIRSDPGSCTVLMASHHSVIIPVFSFLIAFEKCKHLCWRNHRRETSLRFEAVGTRPSRRFQAVLQIFS